LFLLSAGVLSGPLLPTGKARAAVAVPVSQAITQAAGFAPRSNGSAAISLSAFIGFSQMSFMFLTAGEHCLIGWNFLPPPVKAEFGWLSWFVAALPAALTISLVMFFAVQFLLPLSRQDTASLAVKTNQAKMVESCALTRKEWITLTTLILTVVAWLTTSLHGVNEAWVALAALLVFLLTGVLDEKGFRNDLDWGLILFFGVLNSLAVVAANLKVDAFFMTVSGHLLGGFAGQPFGFLLVVFLLVSTVRFFLRKTPTAALFTITLLPLSESVGIHPGILVVVAIMIGECFLLGYQDGPYQIAYAGGGGSAFSHGQARKILAAKYLATLLALAVSVPYWRFFGFIR
jgi:di/tricarboxylate transporter